MSVTEWAHQTFGTRTIEVLVQRAAEEMDELNGLFNGWAYPDDKRIAYEAADVCICLFSLIGQLHPTAIDEKMAINRTRKRKIQPNGAARHVEES